MMQILFLDPYHGGSHAAVATGYAAHSRHQVDLVTLPTTGGWRWRMRGAAVALARLVQNQPLPDLIVTTDMLDLATFRALTRHWYRPTLPVILYFHENQLTYPLPAGRARDLSFAWINYTSALTADLLCFNSDFHRRSFLNALPDLLNRYHDYRETQNIDAITAKATILPPGIELSAFQDEPPAPAVTPARTAPIILWNSRWDYDKQPQLFFATLERLAEQGADFRLIIAGEHVDPNAAEFVAARERWHERIVHWGYAVDRTHYRQLLNQADIVVSTALQEFFGIGIIEALAYGCIPILPARLTYPELLPPEHHAICLYHSPEDLVAKLHHALVACPELRTRDWQTIATPYQWWQLASRYDALFEAVIARNSI